MTTTLTDPVSRRCCAEAYTQATGIPASLTSTLLQLDHGRPVPNLTLIGDLTFDPVSEPLPMKLRALPQSFWLQPNDNSTSPNTGSLPPLVTTSKDAQDINGERSQRPEGARPEVNL